MKQIISPISKEYEENLRKEVAEEISKLSPEEIYKNYTNLQAELFSDLDDASFDAVIRYNMYVDAVKKAYDDKTLPFHRIIFYQELESAKLGAFAGLMIKYTNADKEIKRKILHKFINETNTYDDVVETYYKLASKQCDPTDDKFVL